MFTLAMLWILGCDSAEPIDLHDQLEARAQKLTYRPQVSSRTESFADGSVYRFQEIQLPCNETFLDFNFGSHTNEITTTETDFSKTNPQSYRVYRTTAMGNDTTEYVLSKVILERHCTFSVEETESVGGVR